VSHPTSHHYFVIFENFLFQEKCISFSFFFICSPILLKNQLSFCRQHLAKTEKENLLKSLPKRIVFREKPWRKRSFSPFKKDKMAPLAQMS